MPLVRLDKLITDTGLCSRSQARDLIRRGRAAVDGATVTDPAAKFDPERLTLSVDGKSLMGEEHIYIMLCDIGKYKSGLFIHRLTLSGRS